jgi:hypothetical protein
MRIARSGRLSVLAVPLLLSGVLCAACGQSEDPARTALRQRLEQRDQLSRDELARAREEVGRAIAGRALRVREGDGIRELDEAQRLAVVGVLTDPLGVYDEGLREYAGSTFRVFNAPGISTNAEIEASRRLFIDLETFLPRRFEFAHAFPGYDDYAFDLVVGD